MAGAHWTARLVDSIADIPAMDWDRLAGGNPFVRHGFLSALEASGSATAQTGWAPHHLLLADAQGAIVAAMPLYLKGHSYGEYVFDHAWAGAYERAGGRYYPKLQASVPFTPVTGPRLLASSDAVRRALVRNAVELTEKNGLSGLHVTFATDQDAALMAREGLLIRHDQQFHWRNRGYADFDDFLAGLTARKRKAIRRERREARASGLRFEILEGKDISEGHWDAFHDFYLDTGARKWGTPYLNREFFSLLGERQGDSVVLMLALDGATPVAGALNLKDEGAIYGRYWGAARHLPFLHFEMCYYMAIDYALAHGLARVEAGAQGEHKLLRGYEPVRTNSAHWLTDPGFRAAVQRYLDQETRAIEAEIDHLARHLPYRKG